jgi:DNA-binding NtrC family response regulator
MNVTETVLIVDDDSDVLQAATLALKAGAHNSATAQRKIITHEHPQHAVAALAQGVIDVVLLDMNYSRGATSCEEGLRWLTEIRKLDADAIVIVVTAHSDVNIAVEAMKRGATDFIAKPWSNERLVTTVNNALTLRRTQRDAQRLAATAQLLANPLDEPRLLGQSKAMQRVLSLIARAAPTDANVLIVGENGCGKELVARALHQASLRARAGALVSVDLGAIQASLFESELFGHLKGSFTDAKADRIGRFQAAHQGTLFLDEIGNLPLTLQPKLLTALEQRLVTPVGSNHPIAVDVRVISATNLSESQLRDERQFRPDLLFRLNTVEIQVPPLRERRDDIPLLAQHYVQLYARKYGKPQFDAPLQAAVTSALQGYDWPGNIRALRHATERAVILATSNTLNADDFGLPTRSSAAVSGAVQQGDQASDQAANDDLNLDRLEQQAIERALKRHAWNISLAAKDLGLTRASLYRRMERFGL